MSKEPKRNVYVGHRYVPLVIGEWDKTETYEGLSIVTNEGTSYTSKKRVPKGIDILNEEYWVVTGNYNAQIEEYRKDIREVEKDVREVEKEVGKKSDQSYVDNLNEKVTTQLAHIENKNPIYLKDYDNADSSGINSSTLGLTEAINDAITQRRKLVISSGTYVVDEPIVKDLESVNLIVEGEADGGDYSTTLLWRGGEGTMFTFTGGRNIRFKNIQVTGYSRDDDKHIFTSNSIAFKAQASLIFTNCKLAGFDNIAVWDGGYYHKISHSFIENTGVAFKDFNANNLIFEKTKVINVIKLLTVNGGSGPVYVDGCSLESSTDFIFESVSGAYPSLTIVGSYFENYPDRTPPEKLGSSYLSQGAIYGFGNVTLIGNTILTRGYYRFIYGNELLKQVISMGNIILYAPTNSTLEYFIFHPSSLDTITANDIAYPILGDVGTREPIYISNTRTIASKDSSTLYDPFTKKNINLMNEWRNPTLLSGWVQNEISGNPVVAYRKNGAKVQIKGLVNGKSATGGDLFTLPEGYRPSESVYKITGSGGEGISTLRVYPNGRVHCSTTGVNGVILDGLEFYIE